MKDTVQDTFAESSINYTASRIYTQCTSYSKTLDSEIIKLNYYVLFQSKLKLTFLFVAVVCVANFLYAVYSRLFVSPLKLLASLYILVKYAQLCLEFCQLTITYSVNVAVAYEKS